MGQMVSDIIEVGSLGAFEDPLGIEAGEEAIADATEAQLAMQEEALAYMIEREAIPMEFRDEALQALGALYGEGGAEAQQELIDRAKESPLYGAIMGGLESGEEAIMRQQAATGGLRSGDTSAALAGHAQQLSNKALLQSYNQQVQGLQGLAGIGTNPGAIAQMMMGIGETEAAGIMGSAQFGQDITGQILSGLGGFAQGAGQSAGAAAFSDPRLKDEVQYIGESGGHSIYRWVWNALAEKLGLYGVGCGVMADEVEKITPNAIGESLGYKTVDYSQIGVANV
jgi:hypothetical protein